MCGIAGIFFAGQSPVDRKRIVDGMVGAILHRGPDSDGRCSTSFAEVGFRRLSIIDLAGGHQPLANEDGSIQCFLNGEIYNYVELRQTLIERGHHFNTTSDTEVLPHLYEEHGTEMFRMLNGMFVICVIDIAKQEVLLARDQFGVKQFYYSNAPQGMVFGSELKSVLAAGLVKPEVELSSVLAYLTLFYCPEPLTLVNGVRKLPAGSWMRLKAGKAEEIVRYFEVPPAPSLLDVDLEEAAEETRRLLWRSVGLQLQADVPVGISLSGGIDSSAITCAAVSHQSRGVAPVALTIHWPDTDQLEVASARELCGKLGISHEVLKIPVDDLLDELPLIGWMSDEPVADPAFYSQFCIARVAAQSVKVLLGGAGGDELFGGYGSYGLAKRYAAYNSLPTVIQRSLKPFLSGARMDEDSLDALHSYRRSRFSWHCRTKSNLAVRERTMLSGFIPRSRNPFENFETIFKRYQGYDAVTQQMIVDFQTYLPEQILTMMDRATMAASIEGRVPFLDGPLVNFAFGVSGAVKLGQNFDPKRVLKRAISQDVNRSILQRKKAGMPSPFVSFLIQHVGTIREIVLAPDSFVRSVLPQDWLRDITSHEQKARASFRVLYAILTLEIWHKLFIRDQVYARPQVGTADLFKLSHADLSA